MRKLIQIVLLIGVCLLQFSCRMNTKSIACIKKITEQSLGDSSYISLRISLRNFIEERLVDSSNRIEHTVGKNILFNGTKTRALAFSLSIYEKPNGYLFGYSTVYLANLQANNVWIFDSSKTPNFMLTINEAQDKNAYRYSAIRRVCFR
jgi:hypothetical protein